MTPAAFSLKSMRLAGALASVLVVLSLSAGPASAHHVARFTDVKGDANAINDQLEGLCCDVSTPVVSQPSADIVATSVRTLYRDGRPVATQVRITMAGAIKDGNFGYELRIFSSRCGSIYGSFTADGGQITEECNKHSRRVARGVGVHSKGRTLFVRLPYDLNRRYGLLRPGDRLKWFQTISNLGGDGGELQGPPRLDFADAPLTMTFKVGT